MKLFLLACAIFILSIAGVSACTSGQLSCQQGLSMVCCLKPDGYTYGWCLTGATCYAPQSDNMTNINWSNTEIGPTSTFRNFMTLRPFRVAP